MGAVSVGDTKQLYSTNPEEDIVLWACNEDTIIRSDDRGRTWADLTPLRTNWDMRDAKLLLELLTLDIPPGDGQHHGFFVEDGNLTVSLMRGDDYHYFRIKEADFDKDPLQLADEIKMLMIKWGFLEEVTD